MLGARRSSSISRGSINGTGLLLSVARGLSRLFHNADNLWMPKYTVRLVSWGGGDIDDRGITEFIDVSTLGVFASFWDKKFSFSDLGDRHFVIRSLYTHILILMRSYKSNLYVYTSRRHSILLYLYVYELCTHS